MTGTLIEAMNKNFTCLAVTLLLVSCSSNTDSSETSESTDGLHNAPPLINYALSITYPHDTTAFTEGLLIHNGQLFESTGAPEGMNQTRSLFGVVDLATGRINPKAELDRNKYFGEGITFLNGKMYQLTYQTKIGFVYNAKDFKQIGQFTFPSKEGWGMTTDGHFLIMSDGTSTLTYLDPTTFAVQKTLAVTDYNGAVTQLNELEYIKGYIYANIYHEPHSENRPQQRSGSRTIRPDLPGTGSENKVPFSIRNERNCLRFHK